MEKIYPPQQMFDTSNKELHNQTLRKKFGVFMVIQNSLNLLKEISKLEKKIKEIESLTDKDATDFDSELYLELLCKSYSES